MFTFRPICSAIPGLFVVFLKLNSPFLDQIFRKTLKIARQSSTLLGGENWWRKWRKWARVAVKWGETANGAKMEILWR